MHEYTLVQNLLDEIQAKIESEKIGRIKLVELHVGKLSGYLEENLKQAFEILVADTELRNAQLKLTSVEGSEVLLQSLVLDE